MYKELLENIQNESHGCSSYKVEFYVGGNSGLDITKLNDKIYDVVKDVLFAEDLTFEGAIYIKEES